ncbi:MAG TPA: dimethylamine corrinoid protein 3 [Spirochaetes bacterium]|nr:dimethylamine corrinoid protein 3 [Spirochaetota bacterium]
MPDHIKAVNDAILCFDGDLVKKLVTGAIESGVDPVVLMNEGLSKAIVEIGDRFGREEIFLMELMAAADACMGGVKIVKKTILDNSVDAGKPKGVIVMGTVEGDIHNIGKDIVKTLLEAAGFVVHDIGVDQPAEVFVKKAIEVNAKIVASSALITTTSPNQKKIEDKLREAGIRDTVRTIIGGAATSPEWAEEIGSDYYAPTATDGVNIIKKYFEGA